MRSSVTPKWKPSVRCTYWCMGIAVVPLKCVLASVKHTHAGRNRDCPSCAAHTLHLRPVTPIDPPLSNLPFAMRLHTPKKTFSLTVLCCSVSKTLSCYSPLAASVFIHHHAAEVPCPSKGMLRAIASASHSLRHGTRQWTLLCLRPVLIHLRHHCHVPVHSCGGDLDPAQQSPPLFSI